MKRFICIFVLAAFLGVWMPGAGAYVSEDCRSDSVMSVMDFQQIDAEFGTQKTLVPGVESKWIICRNDPINYIDPDGEFALVIGAAAAIGIGFALGYLTCDSDVPQEKAIAGGTTALAASVEFTMLTAGGSGVKSVIAAGATSGALNETLNQKLGTSESNEGIDGGKVLAAAGKGTLLSLPATMGAKLPKGPEKTIINAAVSIISNLFCSVTKSTKEGGEIDSTDIETAKQRLKTRQALEKDVNDTDCLKQ